jgi:Type II intron maturase/Reverse transcriptase (RNA-dependent DNA polymerase)
MSEHSCGFRPNRGCHTALQEIQTKWTGSRWFVEGDIAKFFDTMNHDVLLAILAGCPQGGVISPILSNIYLDKLDQYVEHVLIPKYTRGAKRADNPLYNELSAKARYLRRKGRVEEAKELRKQFQRLPSFDPHDEGYRRLYYVRYADDTLFGFVGTRREAQEIKQQLSHFLRETLKLEMSQEKTLITHASTHAARFLNYHIVNQQNDTKQTKKRRSANGHIALLVPPDVVESKCTPYLRAGKPIHRTEMLDDDDFTIIERYQQEYRGIVQYYLLAQNVSWFWKLHWVARRSLLKTLAYKHRTSMMVQMQKYKASFQTKDGATYTCLEIQVQREGKKPLVTRFGAIPLKRQRAITIVDQTPLYQRTERTELVKRLLADTCELCESRENVEVHHVRKLADLEKGKKDRPRWVKVMITRRRKTLVVCRSCHQAIHTGQPTRQKISE